MRTPTNNNDLLAAEQAAKTLPEPTPASIEDRDGFRFCAVQTTAISGRPVLQWELMGGTGYLTGLMFRRPWIHPA